MTSGLLETLDEGRILRTLDELGREAARFRFEVAPNPCVGAALYAGERELARGYHRVWGGPHAEVAALAALPPDGERPELLVVTLEPCSSSGKTGPCVDAILAAGVRVVAIGQLDPDLRHRGRGIELLREAGVEVLLLEGGSPLERVAPHFLAWTSQERLRRPRPWTIAKWAQTRTGQLSPPEDVGDGRWISGPEARAEVHELRGRVDAIVTGVGTVQADDPRLTVRGAGGAGRAPLRVVLDSYLRTPPDAALFRAPEPGELAGEVHVLTLAGMDPARARALAEAGAQVHGLHSGDDHVSLRDVQNWLWERGVRRVLLEAGPTLLRECFERGFVDQLRVYTGAVNGGRGPSLAEWLAPHRLEQRADRECGDDSVLEAFVRV
jgi:diaminohydroxyphosphoribosylaminopyrimidine deaminase/5-amino-6-(5-phosphoribosylamino)uracil reductase